MQRASKLNQPAKLSISSLMTAWK